MAHSETTRSSASKGDCGGARRQRCACGVGEGVGCEDMAAATAEVVAAQAAVEAAEAALAVKKSKSRSWQCTP